MRVSCTQTDAGSVAKRSISPGVPRTTVQVSVVWVLDAEGSNLTEIRHAAGRDERGKAASGEAEHADPACIDRRVLWPEGDHIIRELLELRGTKPGLRDAAVIIETVAALCHSRDDESGPYERKRGVVMTAVPPARAMRYDESSGRSGPRWSHSMRLFASHRRSDAATPAHRSDTRRRRSAAFRRHRESRLPENRHRQRTQSAEWLEGTLQEAGL